MKERSNSLRKILKLFESKHGISHEIASTLDSEDIKVLTKIASGKIPESTIQNRFYSFSILSYYGRAEHATLMSRIAGNEEEDDRIRVAAAANLGYFHPEIAEEKLINLLRAGDDVFRTIVIKSLGMIGGNKAYEALTHLTDIDTPFVQKQLLLSTALIAYRLKLEADPLPYIEGEIREGGREYDSIHISVNRANERIIDRALKLLEGSKYGIELSRSIGYDINVGPTRWMLFINKIAGDKGIAGSLTISRLIIGLMARYIEETETYCTQYIILSKSVENRSAQIMVVRPDGEIMYSGKAKLDNDKMSFIISDVNRSGTAPTKVTGVVTTEGIEINVHVASRRREGKRKTKSLEFKDFRKIFSNKI